MDDQLGNLAHIQGVVIDSAIQFGPKVDAGSVTINRNPFATGANHRFISGAGFGVDAMLAGV